MSITTQDVNKVAKLAKLSIDEAKIPQATIELQNILAWIDQLNDVNVDNVAPLESMVHQSSVMRDDTLSDGDHAEQVMQNAPEQIEQYFAVPKVIE